MLSVENRSLKVHVFGVRANNVVVIFMMEFVGFVILPRMFKDQSFKTFPITIQHLRHLRLCALIVEINPTKDYRVGNVFVIIVDTSIETVSFKTTRDGTGKKSISFFS